jgi:hypothetical protein
MEVHVDEAVSHRVEAIPSKHHGFGVLTKRFFATVLWESLRLGSPPWWRRRAVPAENGVEPKVVTEAMRTSAKQLRRTTVADSHD